MGRGRPVSGESLADRCPLQAEEWHPTLNGDLTPSDVTVSSNRKVWWKCSYCDAAWEAIINNRTRKRSTGCKACTRKRLAQTVHVPKAGASLADLHPRLAAELHPTRNRNRTPATVHPGSHTKVWWLCAQCGHEFEMAPRRRTAASPSGCPPCAYRRVGEKLSSPAPGESLQAVRPDVAANWHPTLNAPTGPGDVSHASGYRAWWKCGDPNCGHEWQTAVANRTTGKQTGCPLCSRAHKHEAEAGESLADLHPELLAEWHPHLNGQLDPRRLKPGSSVAAWWRCRTCNHEWQTTVALRAKAGTGCGPCSYKKRGTLRKTPAPDASLAERFPHLVGEWDWDANAGINPAELKPGSDLLVWWQCERRSHRWQARVYRRTGPNPNGCPDCTHLPDEGRSFAHLNPDIALEWHPTRNGDRRPNEFKPSSAYKAWWKCLARGHEWQVSIGNRNGSTASTCPTCTMWGTSASQIRIAYELIAAGVPVVLDHPRIPVSGRRPVAADIVVPDYCVVIEYDGSQYHAAAGAVDRDRRQSVALTEAGWTVIRIRPQALEAIDRQCVRVGNNATVKQIAVATLMKLSTIGHHAAKLDAYLEDPELWAGSDADRAVLNLKSRSLMSEFPDIAAEWHPTRNGTRTPHDINPGSKVPVWWLCPQCGHEWRVRPGHRTKEGGTGCPQCAAKVRAVQVRTPKPGRSMAEVYPQLLRIFHPTKNGDLDLRSVNAGTTREIWWRCPDCGHEWSTKAGRNSGCRPCGSKRRGRQIATPEPGKSLADLHPAIASQWHPTKNGDLFPSQVREGTARLVWWLCHDCGREWRRSPGARVASGAGCRRCAAGRLGTLRKTPQRGQSLADTHPHLALDWLDEKNVARSPKGLKANSLERAWWRCRRCGHEWNARIDTRALRGHGCKKCASAQLSVTKKRPKPGQSMADVKPELVTLWHPTRNPGIQPTDLTPSSHTRVWWLCPDCGHEWQASPGQPGCRPCGMKRSGTKHTRPGPGRSLLERYPAVAKQWDHDHNGPLTPADVAACSNQQFWWICEDCNHHWRARPSNRINSVYLCPLCKRRTVNSGAETSST
ncbi:zinc-ribbon domain-containing protein [Mycobacterium intracellulare]|uniref:zinc-ribbon domain-containing protein n=1 Tax=Mycobacterium intracellulare TaxID=1767 RepID=UPI0039F675B9